MDKQEQIRQLRIEQVKLSIEGLKLATKPAPKRHSTAIKRAVKVVNITVRIRQIDMQIQLIRSQPLKFYPEGGTSFSGDEVILHNVKKS